MAEAPGMETMTSSSQRLSAWTLALGTLATLLVSTLLVILTTPEQDPRYFEILSGAVVACGASILGLVILNRQPRNRIGWLWLLYALAMAFFSLSYSIYFLDNSQGTVPSTPVFVLLLFSEAANTARFICLILLMLWFPDGRPPSPRWRFLYWWTAVSFVMVNLGLFNQRVNWTAANGLIGGPGIVNNPIGFLPESLTPLLGVTAAIGFFSIVAMLVLAALSIFIRYRSAGQMVRAQILWFILGSVFFVISSVASIFFIDYLGSLAGALDNLAIIPFYLAIGIAITRYHLYDIDVIIRKALVYGALTATLALVFFGGVILLQQIIGGISGMQNSPVAIVVSTLAIAGLFTPLRRRIQHDIDRRFYRKKYDAQKTLESFAATARDEVELEKLTSELLNIINETMQPSQVSLWLKTTKDRGTRTISGTDRQSAVGSPAAGVER
jgi:hypothetical protein